MADLREATVPDIGDFTDVPVIEVLVKPGDRVEKDQGLVTLESAKATMEVPAPFAGIVREVKVKENDQVSQGSVIALIEAGEGGEKRAASPQPQTDEKPDTSALPARAGKGARSADEGSPSQTAVPGTTYDRHLASPSTAARDAIQG
ncbi:MAG: branched-chain alpha-keto acid dehydrogenase subunit E2, partial [Rhodanobacteraceae bacterium]